MEFLNGIIASMTEFLNGPALAGVAIALEFVLRLLPTEKPKSILLLVSGVCKAVGSVFTVASSIIDRVIPQRLK